MQHRTILRLLAALWLIGIAIHIYGGVMLSRYSNDLPRFPQAYCDTPNAAYRYEKMDRKDTCFKSADADKLDRNTKVTFVGLALWSPSAMLMVLMKYRKRKRDAELYRGP